jgi:uncharacterized protein
MTPEQPGSAEEPAPAPALPPTPESGNHFSAPDREGFDWIFIGPHGLRVGWSILFFYVLYYVFRVVIATIYFATGLVGETMDDSAPFILITESIPLFSLIASAGLMASVEGRRILSYNLTGPRRAWSFASGVLTGFSALSILVGALASGGWLHFGHTVLHSAQALRFAVLWGCVFLAVASVEEGLFRCYVLSTLARGINFWWALATEIVVCADAFITKQSNGVLGVYLVVGIGLLPCLLLHQKSAARSAFWQAAWVTSSVFALYHTQNNGENWIGVFAAGAVGFLFCLSVRLTGSAWWALGFHAAWDWAETYFYGTADSGLQGRGHLLTSSPSGNPLWSGGADGPEGSLLVLGVILLLFLFLLLVYGRGQRAAPAEP